MVSVNHWSGGIKTYRLSWYLTRVSANHASSNWAQYSREKRALRSWVKTQIKLVSWAHKLRTVPRHAEVFSRSLNFINDCGKSRSQPGLLESKKKIGRKKLKL